jgi:molecular chaperone GrpE
MSKEHKHENEKEKHHNHNEKEAKKEEAASVKDPEKKEEKPKSHEEILAEKDAKLTEMTDKYLRSLAELDNYRKRVSKDKDDFVRFTRSESIRSVLPVLDNLDRAIHATKVTDNVESLKKGVEMVIKQFEDALKEMGASEVRTEGIYDPELHHVIGKEKREGAEEGAILEVFQKGYMMDGILVRPALVKVADKDNQQ